MKERIKEKMSEMTYSQRKIANYILDYAQEAAFITAAELGRRTNTSEATVVRFTAFLGFNRYQDFRQELSALLLERFSTVTRFRETVKTANEMKNNPYLLIMERDMEALSLAQQNLSAEDLDRIAQKLVQATSVYIAAFRSSYSLAYYFSFYLSWLLPNVRLLCPELGHEILNAAPDGGVVVGISFRRYSAWTLDILNYAHKRGMETVVITDEFSGHLNGDAHNALIVPFRQASFIDSLAVPMSAVNCLIFAVAQQLGEDVDSRFKVLEDLWHKNKIYTEVKKDK